MAKRTAIIDIGSNSVRMIIFEKTSRFAFHLLHEAKSRVRISENAYKNNNYLQPKPLKRAFNVLEEFQEIIKKYKVTKTLCIATSALRDAPNKKEFISKVKKDIGLKIKVIDGQKEAYLGGIAAANLLYLKDALTIDIGGGSTELALYKNKKVIKTISLNLGTVRLKELFFDTNDIKGAIEYIKAEFNKLDAEFKCENIIGIGGTLRAFSKMISDKNKVPFNKLHAFSYKIEDEEKFSNKLLNSNEEELKLIGVKKERLDVIKPGILILSTLIQHIQAKHIISSGVGVREGLFLSDLLRTNADKFPHNFNPSIKSLTDRFDTIKNDTNYGAKKLFNLLAETLNINPSYKESFLQANKISHIGEELNFYNAQRHAYYTLLNNLNYGFSHQSTILISTLVRFQEKGFISSSHLKKYSKYLPEEKEINTLIYLMSLNKIIFGEINQEVILTLKDKKLNIEAKYSYLIEDKLSSLKSNLLDISVN